MTARWQNLLDPVTGLRGQGFFLISLDDRMTTARRHLRPLSVVHLALGDPAGSRSLRAVDPVLVGSVLTERLRSCDVVGRLPGGRFGIVLDEATEEGAVVALRRLQEHFATTIPNSALWAGVACYPAHGLDTVSVKEKAEDAFDDARDWSQSRIEIARA